MTTAPDMPADNEQLADEAAPLDALLVDAALGPARRFLPDASTAKGSWWPDMAAWLGDRSGAEKPAPEELGGGGPRPLAGAPGTYVFDT